MTVVSSTYPETLSEIKVNIHQSTLRSELAANAEMILLYWTIGKTILDQQKVAGRGAKVIEHLADDLRRAFPGMKGLSLRNLKYMRQFSAAYPDPGFVRKTLTQITWYHHVTLLSKITNPDQRNLFIKLSSKNRWSRNAMLTYIRSTVSDHH
ncbi:DUF1016 N-terminal domain-containing protein [Dyadobacter psychrophilus]|uniref:Predicted nuclease of restriction endonuclease-like (RecB) superfamily, DUF1016 family n=1 Tax=Dyadobacter psychrophilus TaxID=651661 RepID=A0A1T5HIZ2_9BACT|nr:DUF1016 N-terminal domain-containing protein [Dyadobacter psychrophilus]SKC20634.1 Predicted nuclease of restriction endonuclease-like (RecB) superfamily, DUF1016 family [Dyadobacter psychrophilus]